MREHASVCPPCGPLSIQIRHALAPTSPARVHPMWWIMLAPALVTCSALSTCLLSSGAGAEGGWGGAQRPGWGCGPRQTPPTGARVTAPRPQPPRRSHQKEGSKSGVSAPQDRRVWRLGGVPVARAPGPETLCPTPFLPGTLRPRAGRGGEPVVAGQHLESPGQGERRAVGELGLRSPVLGPLLARSWACLAPEPSSY